MSIPLFLSIVGLFLVAGIAAAIIEKVGQHGPDMAKTLTLVVSVLGLGVIIGSLFQIINQTRTVFNLF